MPRSSPPPRCRSFVRHVRDIAALALGLALVLVPLTDIRVADARLTLRGSGSITAFGHAGHVAIAVGTGQAPCVGSPVACRGSFSPVTDPM